MEYYSEDEAAYLLAMQMTSASVFPMVLKCAIELDLLELIKKDGPVSAAAQLPTTNAEAHVMIDRILRLLTTNSVLDCTVKQSTPNGGVERLYSLAPVCKYLTKNDDGVSIALYVRVIQDKAFIDSWCHLKDAVLEVGVPFNKAYGMSSFEYIPTDPRFATIYNQFMSNNSTIVLKRILETYKGFEGLESLVDVGGGIGASINMILNKYPSIKAINFDLPHVVKHAPPYPLHVILLTLLNDKTNLEYSSNNV